MIRSRESALVAMVPSHALGVQLETRLADEVAKGCEPTIWRQPVALEPPYTPLHVQQRPEDAKQVIAAYENGAAPEDLVRLQIWISPEWVFQWPRCESFVKQLSCVSDRLLFEIAGNRDGVSFSLGCHREDLPTVQTAFEAEIEHCMVTPHQGPLFDLATVNMPNEIRLRDYRPEPPYHHLLTRPEELKDSPYESLMAALVRLLPPAVGLYQVVFQPVAPSHNWHENVQDLTDLEHRVAQVRNQGIVQRYAQPIPSNEVHHTADKLESKAHNDKPFFAAAVRIAVADSVNPRDDLQALTTAMNLFQHGGRPLSVLTEIDYGKVLGPGEIRQMLSRGLTYRPGFLLNSDELTGFVHIPPASLSERWESVLNVLDPFTAPDLDLSEGVPIGVAVVAGREQLICVDPRIREGHIHMVGDPGMGKSCLEESMILYDTEHGHGVAVLDPHGDLVDRLLTLLPKEAVDRTIYFNPGDPEWVPIWNPMSPTAGQDIGCSADNLIGVLKSSVTNWGDRMETILRQAIFGLNHLPYASFLDLSDLLRTGTKEGKELKEQLLQVVRNVVARQFWLYDHEEYRSDEFGPPRHKLSKLLVGGTSALMLSQPYSRFSFRHIIDDGMIFLADLSTNLGTEVCDLLGGFILATWHATALSRSDTPPQERKPFYVYVDETPRFVTDRLQRMLTETRKFGVHLTLAHQHMQQFSRDQVNALASVGTTIVFNVGRQDAEYLAKDFLKTVRADDIRALEPREALVRIGRDMARIRTLDRPATPDVNFRDEIIEQSRQRYCRHISKVQEEIQDRHRGSSETFSPLVPSAGPAPSVKPPAARLYDEL